MPDGPPRPYENQLAVHLLARIVSEDATALSELYDIFSLPLRAICLNLLGDAGDADDLLQEVFIKVWHRAGDYSPALGSPAAWLITIMRHASLNRLRSRLRNRAAVERAAQDLSSAPSEPAGTYQCVVAAETARMVRKALAGLPDEQRTPLEMAYMKGMTYEEVAAQLGQPLGSIKSRLRRAMARMKSCLADFDPTES